MTREIITCTKESGMAYPDIFELKPICNFCHCEITEENFGGVYNKPAVVICDNLCCLIELSDIINDDFEIYKPIIREEAEFNPLHIYLGGMTFLFLCRYILEFFYNIFNNPIFVIVMIIILIKIFSIWYSEMKIWVRVS